MGLENTMGGRIMADIRSLFTGESTTPRPGSIGLVPGHGYRRISKDANGNTVYHDLTPQERQANGGQFSFQREDSALARERSDADKAQLEARSAAAQRRDQANWEKMYGLQQTQSQQNAQGLQASITQAARSSELQAEQLRQTVAEGDKNRAHNSEEARLTRGQQSEQFNATIAQQTRQLELNNELMTKRLGMEDRHFERQMALDERNARRTKVLGALTLISQSLQRL